MIKVEQSIDAGKLRMKPEVGGLGLHCERVCAAAMFPQLLPPTGASSREVNRWHGSVLTVSAQSPDSNTLRGCCCVVLTLRLLQVVLMGDVVQKRQALEVLMSYNPFWLRLAAEVVTQKPVQVAGEQPRRTGLPMHSASQLLPSADTLRHPEADSASFSSNAAAAISWQA